MAKQINTAVGRFYELPDGQHVPSVTHVLGLIAKPALVNWAAKMEREACIQAAADLYIDLQKLPKPLTTASYVATLDGRIGKQKAHKREMEKAAEIGTLAHRRVEWTVRKAMGQPVGPEPPLTDASLWAFMAWEDWWRDTTLRPLHAEQTVFSVEHRYAGTMDLLAVCERPLTVGGVTFAVGDQLILDWKTSKGIYAESFLQNVAYQQAVDEMGHGPIAGGLIVRLPKVTTDPAFEVALVPPRQTLLPTFLAVRAAWDWWHAQEVAFAAKRKGAA